MKIAFILMLMIVSLAGVFTLKTATPRACNLKDNPFLARFKKGGVNIESSPRISSQTSCSYEWSANGTCCDETTLMVYAKNDAGYSQLAVEQMQREILFAEEVTKLISSGIRILLEKISKNQLSEVIEYEEILLLKQFLTKKIKPIDEFMTFLSQNSQQFAAVQSKCGSQIKKMRNAALCSLCSGRGEGFLIDKKAIVLQSDCSVFVDSCFESWTYMVKIIDGMKAGAIIISHLKLFSDAYFPVINAYTIRRMTNWLKKSGLVKLVDQCGPQGLAGCSQSTKDLMCDKSLNLAKKTYLTDILGFMKKKTAKDPKKRLEYLQGRLDLIEKKIKNNSLKRESVKITLEKIHIEMKRLQNQQMLQKDIKDDEEEDEDLDDDTEEKEISQNSSNNWTKRRLQSNTELNQNPQTAQAPGTVSDQKLQSGHIFSDITVSPLSGLHENQFPVRFDVSFP